MSFTELLESRVPIIQAPMAGGINTPELVAAVCNAGAIGSFGFAYSAPEAIEKDLAATRQLTCGPVNVNFFIFNEVSGPTEDEFNAAVAALQTLPLLIESGYEIPEQPYFPSLASQLEPVWRARPQILTFHFGLPPQAVIEKAHDLGILIGVTATSADEAISVQQAGADFIVAQGIEAGGHRGTFSATAEGDQRLTTTELLQSMLQSIQLPVVCAGGIMNGEHVRRLLDQGASAAQLGTAFLCCNESGTNPVYRRFLIEEHNRSTVLTRGFSGRWAQAIEGEFTRAMQSKTHLAFPLQNTLTGALRKAATEAQNGEYQSLWAGVNFQQVRPMPAAELIRKLTEEMNA